MRIGQAINLAVGTALAIELDGTIHCEAPKDYGSPGIIISASRNAS